jgi:hypothetical protein
MSLVSSLLGAPLAPYFTSTACWAVKLSTGDFLSERDSVKDEKYPGGIRAFDWTLDMVATGDWRKIRELWLLCPPSPGNPLGQGAQLIIERPGTAFQLKVGFVHGGASAEQGTACQLIGRVYDPYSGQCSVFAWDNEMQQLVQFQTSVYDFVPWRPEIGRLHGLSHDTLGLSLA